MLYLSETAAPKFRVAPLLIAGLLVAGIFMLTGCDSIERFAIQSQRSISNFFTFSDHEEYTAQELALNGMEAYERGNYRASARNFQELKDFYPFSQYAALADLKLGDSYYQRRQYDKAIEAYEEFERLHPRNEAVPYVIYKIGMCYFDRMPTVDRDQTFAMKAMETFQRLQRQFPDNEYALLVNPLIPECLRKLAGHEFAIGLFYFETRHWSAAKMRFEKVLRNYPDVGYHREAMIYLVDCERRIAEEEQAVLADQDATGTSDEVAYPTITEQNLSDGQEAVTDQDLIEAIAPEMVTEDIHHAGEIYPDL